MHHRIEDTVVVYCVVVYGSTTVRVLYTVYRDVLLLLLVQYAIQYAIATARVTTAARDERYTRTLLIQY